MEIWQVGESESLPARFLYDNRGITRLKFLKVVKDKLIIIEEYDKNINLQ